MRITRSARIQDTGIADSFNRRASSHESETSAILTRIRTSNPVEFDSKRAKCPSEVSSSYSVVLSCSVHLARMRINEWSAHLVLHLKGAVSRRKP